MTLAESIARIGQLERTQRRLICALENIRDIARNTPSRRRFEALLDVSDIADLELYRVPSDANERAKEAGSSEAGRRG